MSWSLILVEFIDDSRFKGLVCRFWLAKKVGGYRRQLKLDACMCFLSVINAPSELLISSICHFRIWTYLAILVLHVVVDSCELVSHDWTLYSTTHYRVGDSINIFKSLRHVGDLFSALQTTMIRSIACRGTQHVLVQ